MISSLAALALATVATCKEQEPQRHIDTTRARVSAVVSVVRCARLSETIAIEQQRREQRTAALAAAMQELPGQFSVITILQTSSSHEFLRASRSATLVGERTAWLLVRREEKDRLVFDNSGDGTAALETRATYEFARDASPKSDRVDLTIATTNSPVRPWRGFRAPGDVLNPVLAVGGDSAAIYLFAVHGDSATMILPNCHAPTAPWMRGEKSLLDLSPSIELRADSAQLSVALLAVAVTAARVAPAPLPSECVSARTLRAPELSTEKLATWILSGARESAWALGIYTVSR